MWPTIYFILALGGLVLLLVALFGDRPRGRRRCPRCFYRIATQPPKDGSAWRCSECGREVKSERHLRRTRRHWWWALAGLVIFLSAWIYPKRAEFQRHGLWAAVPTIATLPILGALDDHWRQKAVDGDGEPLTPLAEVLLDRTWGNHLSWLDWKLLLLRIRIGNNGRLFAQPERYAGLPVTLHSSILNAADDEGKLSAKRIEELDSLTHLDIDFISPWVPGEPLPARLHLRDWRARSIESVVVDVGKKTLTLQVREGGHGEGNPISQDYQTWHDGFVELPPPNADGTLTLFIQIDESTEPLFPFLATPAEKSKSGGDKLSIAATRTLHVALEDDLPIAPFSSDPVLDDAVRSLAPTLVFAEGDQRLRQMYIGASDKAPCWIDVPVKPLRKMTTGNTGIIMALRFELWRDDELLGYASAWWAARTREWRSGEMGTAVRPVTFSLFYRVLFRPTVNTSHLEELDLSKCTWRIVADPLMVRRCLAARERDPLSEHWLHEWTSYWDGEVIIDAGKAPADRGAP